MEKFRVKAGQVFGVRREYKSGDVVELEADAYKGFEDILEPLGRLENEAEEVAVVELLDKPANEIVAPDDGVPDDNEDAEEVADTSGIPQIVINAAKRGKLESPDDFVFLTDDEILAINRVGKAVLKEIRALYPYGG